MGRLAQTEGPTGSGQDILATVREFTAREIIPVATEFRVAGGDVMSGAPELARLTLNVAKVHHDQTARAAGRLVYGGHTIVIALRQAVRALPGMVTVVGWRSCDHAGPYGRVTR